MGTPLFCLESMTHHNFQFGLKGFKCFRPSMVQIFHLLFQPNFQNLADNEVFSHKFATSMVHFAFSFCG
jgi:hypothetical protein